jgi:hypothetical protein
MRCVELDDSSFQYSLGNSRHVEERSASAMIHTGAGSARQLVARHDPEPLAEAQLVLPGIGGRNRAPVSRSVTL